MANAATREIGQPSAQPVARVAGALLDRLFTPHGASAYLRWVGLAPPPPAVSHPADVVPVSADGAGAVSVVDAVDGSDTATSVAPSDGTRTASRPKAVDGTGPSVRRRPAGSAVTPDGSPSAGAVRFASSGLTAVGEGTLLETAEAAGLEPRNRCRRGICGTCTTPKLSGTVVDVRTGERSDAPGPIRICVSVADGDVALDL